MSVKLRQVRNSANLPMSLDIGTEQAQGITVDNYSGYWLQVGTAPLFVPPFTIGWANNFDGGTISGINIVKNVPSSFVVNPAAGQAEGPVVATLYGSSILPSAGVASNSKPVKLFSNFVNNVAGTYNMAIIDGGSTIIAIDLSGIITGGTIAEVRVALTDGTVFANLMRLIIGPTIPSFLTQRQFVIPITLNPARAWTLQIVLNDIAGVNTYFVDLDVIYM